MKKTILPPDDIRFIINALRHASIKWEGRAAALKRARKKVFVRIAKNGNKVFKLYWMCAKCEKWFREETQMEVDHVVEIGSFNGDLNEYCERMFDRDPDALQVLCVKCHLKKTKAFNAANTKWKRKKPR